jgi:L-lactate utilization protein LutC
MNRELLKKNFENHRFKTSFFANKEQATEYIVGSIKGASVGFGGSMTVAAMGLIEKLSHENTVYDHTNPNIENVADKARNADYFICSANAVSETGELVNIDGRGNRVSATLMGPKKMFFIVGRNKIVPTEAEAITRARNLASPPNCKRLNKKTPCAAKADACYDCNSPERICNAVVIYERPMSSFEEVEVVFIDEDLGF